MMFVNRSLQKNIKEVTEIEGADLTNMSEQELLRLIILTGKSANPDLESFLQELKSLDRYKNDYRFNENLNWALGEIKKEREDSE